MSKNRNNSPYSAAITGASFLFDEFNRVLPLMLDVESDRLLKQEIIDNNVLQVNSETSRKRFVSEFRKRFKTMPKDFWDFYTPLSEPAKRAALLFVMLKTYKIVFEFHVNVAMKKWRSANHIVEMTDVEAEIYELASKDEFVDSWTPLTKRKTCMSYLTMLRQAGMLDSRNELVPLLLDSSDYEYYFTHNEQWFLEACLLQPYQIETIKKSMI